MADLTARMQSFVDHAFGDLFTEYKVFSIAAILLFIIAPLITVRLMQRYYRKSYFFKTTTERIPHYLFIGILVLDGIRLFTANTTALVPGAYYCAGAVLILILIAAVQLLRWRPSGVILTYIAISSFTIFKNWVWVTIALHEDLASYSLLGTFEMYAYYDYYLFSGMMLSLVSVALGITIAIYYYRRRYVFRSIPAEPRCSCGNIIRKGDNYCISCRRQTTINPVIDYPIARLDKELFCHKCGSKTLWDQCMKCETKKSIVVETLKEKGKDIGIGIILTAVFFLLLLLPVKTDIQLESGTSKLNNAYVTLWNEYTEESSRVKDNVWLQKFNSALDALYTIDSRFAYIDQQKIRFSSIQYFWQYADGAYAQMKALDGMQAMVNEGEGEIEELQNQFNSGNNKMALALTYKNTHYRLLDSFDHSLVDGMRLWFPRGLSFGLIGCVVACCGLLWLLNSFDDRRTWKSRLVARLQTNRTIVPLKEVAGSPLQMTGQALIYIPRLLWRAVGNIALSLGVLLESLGMVLSLNRPRNYRKASSWYWHGLFDNTKRSSAAQTRDWKSTIIGTVIGLGIVIGVLFIPQLFGSKETTPEDQFKTMANEALVVYFSDIDSALLELRATETLDDPNALIALINKQIAADQVVLDYEFSDEVAEYAEFYLGLKALCEDDIECLEPIRQAIVDGLIPSQPMLYNLMAVRGQNYKWVLVEYAKMQVGEAAESFFD